MSENEAGRPGSKDTARRIPRGPAGVSPSPCKPGCQGCSGTLRKQPPANRTHGWVGGSTARSRGTPDRGSGGRGTPGHPRGGVAEPCSQASPLAPSSIPCVWAPHSSVSHRWPGRQPRTDLWLWWCDHPGRAPGGAATLPLRCARVPGAGSGARRWPARTAAGAAGTARAAGSAPPAHGPPPLRPAHPMAASGAHSSPSPGAARAGTWREDDTPPSRGRSLSHLRKILEAEEAFAQGAPSGEGRCDEVNFYVGTRGADAVALGTGTSLCRRKRPLLAKFSSIFYGSYSGPPQTTTQRCIMAHFALTELLAGVSLLL